MIQMQTERGGISVNSAVFTNIVGMAASNCFGVKGMAVRSMTDEAMSKGVLVNFHEDNSVSIDLHIIVDHGVNLSAVANSIISEVRYIVEKTTETTVRTVNVFIDSMVVGA